jgi:hypothetical protein
MAETKTKSYSGRLAFDSDSGFHIDEDGKKLVSEDGGKTWRYASDSDPSHLERYHQRFVTVDGTANEPAAIALQALGDEAPIEVREALRAQISPHHFGVQPGDAHYDPDNPGKAKLSHDPDSIAPKLMSHTEAYKDAPVEHPAVN